MLEKLFLRFGHLRRHIPVLCGQQVTPCCRLDTAHQVSAQPVFSAERCSRANARIDSGARLMASTA
jgi:hypothetical protein